MRHFVFSMMSTTWLIATSIVPAEAVEPLLAQELVDHCAMYPDDVESADGQYCVRYVQGFIDGAVVTDERVLRNVEAEYEEKMTLTERAIRSRGPGRDLRSRASRYAEFCLGEPIPLVEVVAKVVSDLRAQDIQPDSLARTAVYASLRKRYPCE